MSSDTGDRYAQALAAIGARDRLRARQLLAALVGREPRRAEAWLLLSTLVDDVSHSIQCLQRAVALDPANQQARRWLASAVRARTERDGSPSAEASAADDPDAAFVPLEPEDLPIPRLGRCLLDFGFVTEPQLHLALITQGAEAAAGVRRLLGGILVEQGALTPERLDFALREQERLRADAARNSAPLDA
jgi:hypothetical protein